MAKKKAKLLAWPKTWQHKTTKKKFKVMPWWECLDPLMADDKATPETIDVGTHLTEGRKFKIGAIVQIGWLLENGHGVWFGMGPKAAESFNEVKK